MYKSLNKLQIEKLLLAANFLLIFVCFLLVSCGEVSPTLNNSSELKKVTLKELSTVKGLTKDWITSLSLSSDNKLLVSSGSSTNVKVWKLADNQLAIADELKAYTTTQYIAINPANNLLAVSSSSGNGSRIIDLASGKVKFNLNGQHGMLISLAFSPDSKLLATGAGAFDNTIRLWDTATGQELPALPGSDAARVLGLTFSPDNRFLASSHYISINNHPVKVWHVVNKKLVVELNKGAVLISSVVFSRDGKLLIGGTEDGYIVIWDTSSYKQLKKINVAYPVQEILLGSDNKMLVAMVGGQETSFLKILDITTEKELFTGDSRIVLKSVALTSDDAKLITGDANGTLKLYSLTKE